MKPMSHYEFRSLVCLEKIDHINFGGRDHLFSAVQRRGIRNNLGLHILLMFQHRGI